VISDHALPSPNTRRRLALDVVLEAQIALERLLFL